MATLQYQDGSSLIMGYDATEDLSYTVIDTQTVTGGSASQQTIDDAVVNVTTGGSVGTAFKVDVTDSTIRPGYSLSVDPVAAAICTVASDGQVSHLSNGTAVIRINAASGLRKVSKPISVATGESVTELVRYRSMAVDSLAKDTLAYHISKTVDDILAAQVAAHPVTGAWHEYRAIYNKPWSVNSYNPNVPDAVRNTDAWFADLDITPISCAQGNGGYTSYHPANLIGPRHALTILHQSFWASGKCVWLGTDGQYYSANIIQTYDIGTGGSTDTRVCYLDAAIPAAVTKFKLLPADWADYLPSHVGVSSTIDNPLTIPCLMKQAKAGDYINVHDLAWFLPGLSGGAVQSKHALSALRAPFYSPVVHGDSGSPHFLVINGQPVLFGQATGMETDIFLTGMLAEIQTGMRATAQAAGDPSYATYAPLIADLSGFQSFA